jgi:hypothetical protein
MEYPKDVILQITTHGSIELDENNQPVEFNFQPGMILTKLSAVTPGTCNIMSAESSNYFSREIMNNIDSIMSILLLNSFRSEEELEQRGTPRAVQRLVRDFKREDTTVLKDVEHQLRNSATNIDPDYLKYFHNYDQSYLYSPKKTSAINKFYLRGQDEIFGDPNIIDTSKYAPNISTWEHKINVLNMPGQPDLMREIAGRTHYRTKRISFKDIMDFLYANGVRRVFLFDFSCSIFQQPISETADRATKRDLMKRGLYGGKKTRRRVKKRKTTKKFSKKRKTIKRRFHR